MSIRYRKLTVAIALGGIFTLGIWPSFHSPAIPMDEGMVLVYPEMILKGNLPYRDFESVTGPGNVMILAAAYATFGTKIFVERAVGLLYRVAVLVGIFGITQRWSTLLAAACSFATLVLLDSTDLWASTWLCGLSFALCSLWAAANVASPWRTFAAGLLAGIALIARCNFGLALIATLSPLFLAMERARKIGFLIGGVLGISPLIWMTFAVGLPQIIHSLFIFPVLQLNPGRHLPISQSKGEMIVLLSFQIIASLTNIAAAITELREPITRLRGRLLLGAGLFGLALIHYALQRFDSGHAVNAALVAISFLPLSIFVLVSKMAKKAPSPVKLAVAILVPIVGMHFFLPTFTRYFYRGLRVMAGISPARQAAKPGEELEPGDKGIFIVHNGRPFAFGFPYATDDADRLLTELERVSVPGQRLFVGPGDLRLTNYCDTYIYYLEPQLRPATYFLEMNPGSANAPHSRLASDVANADWVVLNRRWDF